MYIKKTEYFQDMEIVDKRFKALEDKVNSLCKILIELQTILIKERIWL